MLGGRGRSFAATLAIAQQAQMAAMEGDQEAVAGIMPQLRGAPTKLVTDVAVAAKVGDLVRAGDVEGAKAAAAGLSIPVVRAQAGGIVAEVEERLAGQVLGLPGWLVVGGVVTVTLIGLGGVMWWALRD